jgi:hypothetical protein
MAPRPGPGIVDAIEADRAQVVVYSQDVGFETTSDVARQQAARSAISGVGRVGSTGWSVVRHRPVGHHGESSSSAATSSGRPTYDADTDRIFADRMVGPLTESPPDRPRVAGHGLESVDRAAAERASSMSPSSTPCSGIVAPPRHQLVRLGPVHLAPLRPLCACRQPIDSPTPLDGLTAAAGALVPDGRRLAAR